MIYDKWIIQSIYDPLQLFVYRLELYGAWHKYVTKSKVLSLIYDEL